MFVTKLNTTGSALVYSTFLGGAAVDNGGRVTVDGGGNAYVLGFTSSTDFPTTAGAFDTTANGAFDGTLTKLNAAGSALVYSTYFGGNDFDGGAGLVVDSAGNAYVAGSTPSANFPTTPGAYDTTFNNGDAFLAKFNAAGSALVFSTFVGGSDYDSFSAVVLDTAGNAWLTGGTNSADFPITAGAPDSTFNGGGDATIAELELHRFGAAVLDLPRRFAERRRRRHRPRCERRRVRHRQHVLAGLPGDRRSIRPGLERRPPDLLGRRLHHQARHRRRRVHSARAAGRAGRTDAGVAVQRLVATAADHVRLERCGRARCRTPSRSTTPAPSPHRSSASRA